MKPVRALTVGGSSWGDPDRWFRALLGVPGWVLDRFEPAVRPPERAALGPHDVHARVRAGARWPEAHLALEPELHYHLHDDAVLAYQLRGATAFAIGGLNTDDIPGLLRTFRERTTARGARRQLVFPVRTTELEGLRAADFEPVQVGVEAWLDLEGLDFRGNRYEGVRHMRNKARREGVSSSEVVDVGPIAGELRALYDAWLYSKRPAWRMRLLIGSPGLDDPFDRRYFVARREGVVQAFVTVVPGADGQWGVDVMCRRPDAARGAMEHLLLEVCSTLRGEGAHHLSLGPCPMAGVPLEGSRPWLRRIFHVLYDGSLGNRVFGFRNLHRFKSKFRPRWEPVYFGSAPSLGFVPLYLGCRMWGLY